MQMDQIDHAFSTATLSDGPQSLGVSSSDDVSIVDDGSIEVEWYDADEGDPFDDVGDSTCQAAGKLRALEIDQGDRTIVHQGGGIWERDGDQTSVVSEPRIGYDDDSLQLHIMQLDEGEISGSELAAESDHTKSTELTDDIRAAADECSDNESDIAFRIESSYHDAWYTYLEDALEADENPEVAVQHLKADDTVEVTIEEVRDVTESPTFVIEEDLGLMETNGKPIEPAVLSESPSQRSAFLIDGTIRNTGGEDGDSSANVTVSIWDGDPDEVIASQTVELSIDSGESRSISDSGSGVRFSAGVGNEQLYDDLTPGEMYYYTISVDDEDETDEPGSFYYGKDGIEFESTGPQNGLVEPTVDEGTATIGLDVRNIGIEGGERDVTLTFDEYPDITDTRSPHLEYGEEGTVEWSINTSALPAGENAFTLEIDGEEVASGTVEGEASSDDGAFVVVEDEGVDDSTVEREQVVRNDSDTFTVRAGVTSTYPSTENGDVTLRIPDAGIEINESITLGSAENGTVTFDVALENGDFEPGTVYEYDVVADGGGLTETGTFYVGAEGTQFDADVAQNETEDGTVTISADATNIGLEDVDDATATLTLDDLTDADGNAFSTSVEGIGVDIGGNSSLEWTLNRTALPPVGNAVTIEIDDETVWEGTIVGEASGDDEAFVVVEDEGVDDPSVDREQIVRNDGDPFTVTAGIASTYSYDNVTGEATLTIPEAGVEIDEAITLDSGERTSAAFGVDPAEYDFEDGAVYEYDVQAENSSLNETGSFYIGQPGSHFALTDGNASVDETVTISANVHNTGIEDDEQPLDFDLEFLGDLPDELEEDPYEDVEIDASEVERSFGENGTVDLEFNQSALIDGEYEATIATEDDEITTAFTVTAGVDPGRVGLGNIDNATAEISVLSSQVSGLSRSILEPDDHQLGSMTLEVLTERGGETYTEHVFTNPEGGNNINTYPAWQNKGMHVYNTTVDIDEEATLTLASRSYGLPGDTAGCDLREEVRRSNSFGTGFHQWCEEFDATSEDYLVEPVDATADEQEQNLRVRTADDNVLPALQPGNEEQESVDEILADVSDPAIDRDSLWADGELDLEDNEFIFLFETTTECGMADSDCTEDDDDIDALWNSALENTGSGDPNFNDLIVYVRVDRADVNPGTPSITIMPGGGDSTDIDRGSGGDAGTPGDVDPGLEGNASESTTPEFDHGTGSDADAPATADPSLEGSATGSGAPEIGPGSSSQDDGDDLSGSVDTGIDLDSDYIVVG
nr:hypothetical protein [Natronolimnohabitans innermongolicus]